MSFIKISDKLYIESSQIEAVEPVGELDCIIYTHHNSYQSTLPFSYIIGMLEEKEESSNISSRYSENSPDMKEVMTRLNEYLKVAQVTTL